MELVRQIGPCFPVFAKHRTMVELMARQHLTFLVATKSIMSMPLPLRGPHNGLVVNILGIIMGTT